MSDGSKKVRCTCKRCGKINYLAVADVDVTEPYLCKRCDSAFIAWQNAAAESAEERRCTLEHFLAQRPRQ